MIQDTTCTLGIVDDSKWRVRPRVSQRIAMEAPRMFSSFARVLRELFQNAYRAGASRVDVRWDSTSATLEIKDNGTGIEDPQILLDAGLSGWAEGEIIEPAGLGFFSVFNPAFVEWIEITSRGVGNWEMHLTPDDIRRAVEDESVWIPAESRAPSTDSSGLCVRLGLTEKEMRRLGRELIIEARAQYPYAVIFTEDNKTEEIPPRTYGTDLISIETSVGRVEWEMPYGAGYHRGRVCWEYVPFASSHFAKALEEAAQAHPLTELAEIAAHSLSMWHIDPKCAVRPQLPERNELIEDDALRTAASVIVASIVNDMLVRARQDFGDAPERIVSTHSPQEKYTKWLERGKFSHVLLKCLGYAFVEQRSGEVWIEMLDEDSWRAYMNTTLIYSRTAQIIGNEHLAVTLNFMGHEVAYEEGAPIPQIRIIGQRMDIEKCPFVAVAERIEIEGIGEVPFLIEEQPEGADNFTRIVFAGNAEQCVEWFHQHAWPIGYLFVANDNSEWVSREYDEVIFEREEAVEQVTGAIARVWSSELEAALREYYDLKRTLNNLQEAERNLETATRWLRKHREPTFNMYRRSLKAMYLRARYTCGQMKETLARIAPPALRDKPNT